MEFKLLAVDLDGTLFYPKQVKRCIPKKNIKFLQDFIDAGNKVVIVSSRSHFFTKKLEQEVNRPIDFINCTSAQIIADGKIIRDKVVDNNQLKDILLEIDKKYKPLGYLMTSKKYSIVAKDNGRVSGFFKIFYALWYFFQFKYREEYVINTEKFNKELDSGEIYKVMIFFGLGRKKEKITKDINKQLREKYPQFEFSWTSKLNELTALKCTKGDGLEYYCDKLGIDKDNVYVVGDSGNDITMFNKFHKHSYAMKHANKSVKKYASNIISRVYKLRNILLKEEGETK